MQIVKCKSVEVPTVRTGRKEREWKNRKGSSIPGQSLSSTIYTEAPVAAAHPGTLPPHLSHSSTSSSPPPLFFSFLDTLRFFSCNCRLSIGLPTRNHKIEHERKKECIKWRIISEKGS